MSFPSSSVSAGFGTELSIAATSFDGSAQSVGSLVEIPAMIVFANDTDQDVFVADNDGSTKGMTLAAGRAVVFDQVANRGNSAEYFSFKKGTEFFATAPVGTGIFRISLVGAVV